MNDIIQSLVIVLLGLTAMVCARPLTDEEIIRDALIAFGDPNEPDEFPRRRNAISPFSKYFSNHAFLSPVETNFEKFELV